MSKPLLLQGREYNVARRDDLRLELANTTPHSDVVLDLATTDFLDCSCLGVLLAQLRLWREKAADTTLRLQNVAPSIARMLGVLELDQVFVIDSLRSAD